MVWFVGPFWFNAQEGLSQLKRNTHVLTFRLPGRQWFAVKKYGVPFCAQLLISVPVQMPLPFTVIMATERI